MKNQTNYFKLEELLSSQVALDNKIANLPSWEVIENLKLLTVFLNGLREDWGDVINVTSGFRCQKLNKKVGGVDTSCHQLGLAADVLPKSEKFDEFVEFINEWAKDKQFDQIIIESNKNSKWIHIGIYSPKMEQRKMLFNVVK